MVHRAALALSLLLLLLAVALGGRYLRATGGLNLGSGSNDLMIIMLLLLGFVLAGSVALFRPSARNARGSRWTSIVWTAALLGALLFTWQVIAASNRWVANLGTVIDSPATLDAYLDANPAVFAAYDYLIPTGIYLQSFEFVGANDVEMSGLIWQEYGPEVPETVRRGVVLPEQLDDAYNPVEAWRVERDGVEKVGWYFSGTFRQNFNYRHYPFDSQDIWLRLWHPEVEERALLVPDFASYRDLDPATLPGLDTQFVYGGWDPIDTYFSYDLLDYNVDFGLGHGFSGVPDPEFFFNLTVARDSLGPMLKHIVLELAIAILLFFLLMLMAHGKSGAAGKGLTVFDLVVTSGGLLFAVILDHNVIRGEIESQDLTYLERFPLILAAFIVLVVLSAVLELKGWRVPVLGYTGDLVPVLAYWPALLATLLFVTVRVFFFA